MKLNFAGYGKETINFEESTNCGSILKCMSGTFNSCVWEINEKAARVNEKDVGI